MASKKARLAKSTIDDRLALIEGEVEALEIGYHLLNDDSQNLLEKLGVIDTTGHTASAAAW